MLTQATKTRKSQKQVFILCRYAFKSHGELNGTVCSQIRTSEGKEHQVWTHSNGCASSCDCEGFEKSHGRKCSHIKHVEAIEAARKSATVATPVAPIVAQSEVTAQPVIETIATKEVESKRRVIAPLNGNRGFQLCKSWAELEAERAAKKQAESKVA